MGDEADADWQDGLVEWGIEESREYYGQCKYWPACACGLSNGRQRQPDPCGHKARRSRRPVSAPQETETP